MKYGIKFESQNAKPQNLTFQIEGKDRKYGKLEDMEEALKGEIMREKSIMIHWQWEYENNKTQDIQDTKDGETIQKYNFVIYTMGE